MTDQEFYEFRTNVEGTAVSYLNTEDGRTIITCIDGVRLMVEADGKSRQLIHDEASLTTGFLASTEARDYLAAREQAFAHWVKVIRPSIPTDTSTTYAWSDFREYWESSKSEWGCE